MTQRPLFVALALAAALATAACPPPAEEEPAPEEVSQVPAECNPDSPCPGSTCATAITPALATIPADACPRFGEFQSDVDVYSWNTFIALNWPADTSTCEADTGKSILSGAGPVVWETWLENTDVFVASGSQPAAWCSRDLGAPRNFGHVGKVSTALTQGFPDFNEAFGAGPLTDQNGRFVRFEKLLNHDEYNYLTSNDLWNEAGQEGQTISFPTGPSSQCGDEPCGPTGAMEIKAAWKVLSDAEIASGRFYTTQGIVYNDEQGDPSPGPNPVTLGLVGLHFIHKTESQTTWFWSTFEQVDNTSSSFYDPNCTDCPVNTQTASEPYTELDPEGNPINAPTQVERVNPIAKNLEDVPALNAYYRGLLAGSVWEHYELVGTQWATGGAPGGTPAVLANTTIETYFQPTSSCFGCHQAAKTSVGTSADFSYLMMEAQ